MRAAVFNVEFTLEEFWPDRRVPVELRSGCRIPLFHELVRHAHSAGAHLAVLPGGFFRTDRPGGISAAIKKNPPRTRVLVGRDDVSGSRREAWAVTQTGRVSKKFPEIWTEKIAGLAPSKRRELLPELLESIGNRWFQIGEQWFAVYCCGDILIDQRRSPISGCDAAFVLAHNSVRGRWAPKMRSLGLPTFLAQHVKWPASTKGLAYRGKHRVRPVADIRGRSLDLSWIARIYDI